MPNLGNGEEIQEIGRLVRGYHDKVRQEDGAVGMMRSRCVLNIREPSGVLEQGHRVGEE